MSEFTPVTDSVEPARRPSFLSQVTDVVTSPTELFTELRPLPSSPGTGFAAVCLTVLIAILATCALFVSPGAIEDVIRQQQKAMEHAVEQGKMKAADASVQIEGMRRTGPVLFVTIGAVITAVAIMISALGWALVVFVAGKILGGQAVSFGKAYEITGLAFVIGCLGAIATGILIVLRDSVTPPSGALFVEELDPGNKLHNLLQVLNPFSVWMLAVLAIGLACSSGVSIKKAMIAIFGFWIVKALVLIAIGWGSAA